MLSKIRFSIVGEWERVNDSVHPVHSWNDNQIGAQNFMKPRRLTPRALRESISLGSRVINASDLACQ